MSNAFMEDILFDQTKYLPSVLTDFAQFFISKNLGGVVTSWLSESAARLGSGISSEGVGLHRANAQW
jgi:hypothetical protein